ncbi:MAG: aminotransferase class III-fold pyridoxal phosphate-dependent enzyme [Bdellovibrionales bacterium]|nr:aminotransferase class III-fold pyridoxal phosphate-dependent enzyme [Bdellovibrionales bacterium]
MTSAQTEASKLIESEAFRQATERVVQVVSESSSRIRSVCPARSTELSEKFKQALSQFQKDRGRDLFFPFLASGLGSGPLVELEDGSVKFDMITGIGINFFGHSHPDLLREALLAAGSDIYQGNLQPGRETADLLRALLVRVESSRLKHGWVTTCGTMANEIALKIIRQKKFPASHIIAFSDCFAGRSTAMQEITDNPKYREGQPHHGEVHYVPFYHPNLGLRESVRLTLEALHEHLTRYAGKIAGIMMEPVQGEGGFNYAPREYYLEIFEAAKKAGLAIWLDEIQTFGRTGQLFAFQTFELQQYVDVVTAAKMLHASVVLFSEEYNPKPGLVAGTFTGTSASLRVARRVIELLDRGFYGPSGRISLLSDRFARNLQKLSEGSCRGMIASQRNIGGMVAFQPFSGTQEDVKWVLMKMFEYGVVAFQCGHGPILVRMLPPFGVMSEQQVDEVSLIIERALLAVAEERKKKAEVSPS